MPDSIISIILGTGLFSLIFIWRFTSDYSLKKWVGNIITVRGIVTISYELLVFLQLFGIISSPLPFPAYGVIQYAGLIVFLYGIFLAIWAKLTMKKNWGVPAQHDIKVQKELVTHGPFSISRNPIYTGLLLTFAGFELSIRSWFIILIVPLFLFILQAVKKEEKLLEKFFEGKYIRYRQTVPRFIIA